MDRWLVGVGVALALVSYGVYCIIHNHTILLQDSDATIDVRGSAAIALSVSYIAVGVFVHGHWFWESHPRFSFLSDLLKLLAVITFLISFGWGVFKVYQ